MILLSLVGEQPIPNLLPLWQFTEISSVQFAATDTTRLQAEALCSSIARNEQLKRLVVHPILMVEAYALSRTRFVLAQAIADWQRQGENVLVNFTGGTKIMSAAALQSVYGSGAHLMYVSTEKNKVIFYQSDGVELRQVEISLDINVRQYLDACGLEVRLPNPKAAPPPPKEGDHLEQLVFEQAVNSGIFDDVQRNVNVQRLTHGSCVKNELDVVVTRNGRLAVCSCKSGRNVTNEALYELASLSSRENLGIYCGKVLAVAEELASGLYERARSSRIKIVDKSQLDNVAFYLKAATD